MDRLILSRFSLFLAAAPAVCKMHIYVLHDHLSLAIHLNIFGSLNWYIVCTCLELKLHTIGCLHATFKTHMYHVVNLKHPVHPSTNSKLVKKILLT